ncbi:UMP kinase [Patescibacteria group bacterium]|nr:UMP kinase [Patescibacteria group bacterium]
MKYKLGKTIVIAVGGSVVYPDKIDVEFLKRFKKFIEGFTKRGTQFVLIVGGGKLARNYIEAASGVASVTDEDKDWIGIHATRSNAQLVRTIFEKIADPTVIDNRHKVKKLKYPVTVGSGWQPGWSTDYVATVTAHDLGIREVIIAGKPDFVYDKDPQKYKNSKGLPHLSWKEYRKLTGSKWVPGTSSPVDIVAARFAEKNKMKAVVVGGKDLENFSSLLRGQDFKGTLIE